jgi:hypothetical protein
VGHRREDRQTSAAVALDAPIMYVIESFRGRAKKGGMLVKRFALALAVAAAGLAAVAPAAPAQPPQPPLACELILTVPASGTGTEQALANKAAAYERVCGFPPPG